MQTSVTNGGTFEYLLTGPASIHYRALSNELETPTVLICPEDKQRKAAATFSNFSNLNLSYFVGLDVDQTNTMLFLGGDRNITNGLRPVGGILELSTNYPASWSDGFHWTQGNVLLGDGSVQQFASSRLQEAIRNTAQNSHRIALP